MDVVLNQKTLVYHPVCLNNLRVQTFKSPHCGAGNFRYVLPKHILEVVVHPQASVGRGKLFVEG